MAPGSPLRILHVLRAPVGGLFRHVLDLAEGQAARGHRVGIVAGSGGGPQAEARLAALAGMLSLGVHRIPMARQLGLGDGMALRHVGTCAARLEPHILHGHGAKGGAYARLARAPSRPVRVYTPHGGSLHYGSRSPQGLIYGAAERAMMRRTDLFLFESAFARAAFEGKIGHPKTSIVRVVPNGVSAAEFEPVTPPDDATDLVSIGELRHLKGTDVLIEAIAALHAAGRPVKATVVGEGPDGEAFRSLVQRHKLEDVVRFAGFQPARTAFAMGRLLTVTSRAESLPYVVLEAAAAGIPMIATRVGGIPEIYGSDRGLLPPGDPGALADAIVAALDDPAATQAGAQALRSRVRSLYSQDAMVEGVLAAYGEAIAAKFHRSH
jgi:glycosyltransferase involved in cell wall biosynthesis